LLELRRFYLGLGILLAVLATIGFWPRYFGPLLSGGIDREPVIHVHAAVYVGWLALFVLQCVLVAAGKIALHRQVGKFGIVYGCVIVVVGLATTVARFATRLAEGGIEAVQNTAIFPLTDMLLFSGFFAAAVYYRSNPDVHRRLMVVAASTILVASTARFTGGLGYEGTPFHAINLALWLSPILIAMAYDFARHRKIHAAYVVGGAAIALSSFRGPLQYTDTWMHFTHWLASVLP
jgi:hypothetical protein